MNKKVSEALRETIRVASDCDDLESVAALHMVRAVMLARGEREIFIALKPIAQRLLGMEESWPAELDA